MSQPLHESAPDEFPKPAYYGNFGGFSPFQNGHAPQGQPGQYPNPYAYLQQLGFGANPGAAAPGFAPPDTPQLTSGPAEADGETGIQGESEETQITQGYFEPVTSEAPLAADQAKVRPAKNRLHLTRRQMWQAGGALTLAVVLAGTSVYVSSKYFLHNDNNTAHADDKNAVATTGSCTPPVSILNGDKPAATVTIQANTNVYIPLHTNQDPPTTTDLHDNDHNIPTFDALIKTQANISRIQGSQLPVATCAQDKSSAQTYTINRSAIETGIDMDNVPAADMTQAACKDESAPQYKCVPVWPAGTGLPKAVAGSLYTQSEADRINSIIEDGGKNNAAYAALVIRMSDGAILKSLGSSPAFATLNKAVDDNLAQRAKAWGERQNTPNVHVTFTGTYRDPYTVWSELDQPTSKDFSVKPASQPTFTINTIPGK